MALQPSFVLTWQPLNGLSNQRSPTPTRGVWRNKMATFRRVLECCRIWYRRQGGGIVEVSEENVEAVVENIGRQTTRKIGIETSVSSLQSMFAWMVWYPTANGKLSSRWSVKGDTPLYHQEISASRYSSKRLRHRSIWVSAQGSA